MCGRVCACVFVCCQWVCMYVCVGGCVRACAHAHGSARYVRCAMGTVRTPHWHCFESLMRVSYSVVLRLAWSRSCHRRQRDQRSMAVGVTTLTVAADRTVGYAELLCLHMYDATSACGASRVPLGVVCAGAPSTHAGANHAVDTSCRYTPSSWYVDAAWCVRVVRGAGHHLCVAPCAYYHCHPPRISHCRSVCDASLPLPRVSTLCVRDAT